jgi:hypothetical protein
LIGISNAYKESGNCRLEAQYAMQQKRDTIRCQTRSSGQL